MNLPSGSILLVVLAAGVVRADIADVYVTRDATLYSDTPAGSLANGSGQYLFAGVNSANNAFSVRRGLLYFDVAGALPVGAVVTSATLRMTVDRVPGGAGASYATLHVASAAWGEGPSDPTGLEGTGTAAQAGDATWMESFFGLTAWSAAGGDYAATASATQTLSGIGAYLFSSPALVGDVQAWVDNPAMNYGWFLLGDETGDRNARRFISGDLGDEDAEPLLTLEYIIVPEPAVCWLLAGSLLMVGFRSGRVFSR